MQPYFFPYLGHFALISAVDEWIVFDVTQYTPKSWMNRNRILHPNSGWQYVTVPLSNSSISIKTSEAAILNTMAAKNNILGKLSHYKKKSPYFNEVALLVQETFDSANDDTSLVNLNVKGLKAVCDYLSIPFNFKVLSQENMKLPESLPPGRWALEICKKQGAKTYINPIGGKSLFDSTAYAQQGIDLQFADFIEFSYKTSPCQYESNLSIIDVLMWNSPQEVSDAISKCLTIYSS